MKKVMIALATVAMAAGLQAATVSWKMGTGIKPNGANNAASGTLNMYVWTVSESVYNSTAVADIWTTYGKTKISEISGFTASVTGKGGAMGGTASQTVTPPETGTDTYYALVITTYDSDKDGTVDSYIVNKGTATMNSAGTAGGGASLALYNGGSPTGGAVTWTAVPEPTSGLLLLLGLAGLALKRKHT